MNRFLGTALLFVAGVFALVLPAAAAPTAETVSAQVNVKTPGGTSLIGTVVVDRGATTGWSFNGMVNGVPASAAGTAVERWEGGELTIEPSAITEWNAPVPQPALNEIRVVRLGSGLISVLGVPLAIGGELLPPGQGMANLTIALPGAGSAQVTELPNTASLALPLHPLAIAGLLAGLGGLLLLLSWRLRDGARRRLPIAEAGKR